MKNKILIITSLIVFLVGCTVPAIAEENVLRIGTTDEVKSLTFLGDYYLHLIGSVANPALTQMDENGKMIGNLADTYEVSPDDTVWTFTLKNDQFWSDGEPVTGEDVAFSIMWKPGLTTSTWIQEKIKDIQVDGNKVTITLTEPYPNLDKDLINLGTFPKHICESIEKPLEYTSPGGSFVGCGPFYIDSVDLNAGKLIFKKNPYWKGKAPYYDTIEVSWFKNEDTVSKAIESGTMDTYWKYASSYPYEGIAPLEVTGNFKVLEKPSSALVYLGFNLDKEPASDLEFRKAISEALNYQEFVEIFTLGHGKVPNTGFIPSIMNGYVETDPLEYNPDEAEKILEDAGYKDTDGNGIREGKDGRDIILYVLIREQFNREADLVKEYLEKIGIGVEIHTGDQPSWGNLIDSGVYDALLSRTTPAGMYKQAGWGTGYFDSRDYNHTVSDPTFLDLIDNTISTRDKTKIAEYATEVQEYYAENLPGIALYWKNDVTPFNKVITGWYSNPIFGIINEFTFTGVKPVA